MRNGYYSLNIVKNSESDDYISRSFHHAIYEVNARDNYTHYYKIQMTVLNWKLTSSYRNTIFLLKGKLNRNYN